MCAVLPISRAMSGRARVSPPAAPGRATRGTVARSRRAMDQATQRLVTGPGLVSRHHELRVHGSKHRIASGLLHGDLDLDQACDVDDHAISVAVVGRDAHELSLSEGLQHAGSEPTRMAPFPMFGVLEGGHFARRAWL
jgi:hypothetical protein